MEPFLRVTLDSFGCVLCVLQQVLGGQTVVRLYEQPLFCGIVAVEGWVE